MAVVVSWRFGSDVDVNAHPFGSIVIDSVEIVDAGDGDTVIQIQYQPASWEE